VLNAGNLAANKPDTWLVWRDVLVIHLTFASKAFDIYPLNKRKYVTRSLSTLKICVKP
jgi:hypothetical protein